MRFILTLFFCISGLTAKDYSPFLLKKVVTGGSNRATVGQVIAGHKNSFHVGIRTPRRLTTSVQADENIALTDIIYPNPCNGIAYFSLDNIKQIIISDLYGKIYMDAVNLHSKTITLQNRGVYYVRMITQDNKSISTQILFQ
jgi:hypothetical protein